MTSPERAADRTQMGLGRTVAQRWSRPGPPGRQRPAPLGSVAAGALRFSAGLARPPQVRRQLAGPGEIRPGRLPENLRPPRWWNPSIAGEPAPAVAASAGSTPGSARPMAPVGWGAVAAVRPTLPARGLRRAAKGVPTEGNRVPGGMTQNMAGTVAPVRRLPDVKAAGPMTGADSKLLPPKSVPAQHISTGPRQPLGRGAAGPPGVATGDGEIRRSAAVPRAGISNAAPAAPGRPGPVNRERAAADARGQHDRPGSSIPGPAGGRGWLARRRTVQVAAIQRSAAPPAVRHVAQPTDPRSAESLSAALRRSWARPASVPTSTVRRRTEVGPALESGSLGGAAPGGGRGRSGPMAESRSPATGSGLAGSREAETPSSTTRARTTEIGSPATPARTSPVAMSLNREASQLLRSLSREPSAADPIVTARVRSADSSAPDPDRAPGVGLVSAQPDPGTPAAPSPDRASVGAGGQSIGPDGQSVGAAPIRAVGRQDGVAVGRTLQRASGARRLASAVRRSIGGSLGSAALPRAAGALPGPDVPAELRRSASAPIEIRTSAKPVAARPPALVRPSNPVMQPPTGTSAASSSRAPSVELGRSSAPAGPAGGSTPTRAAAPVVDPTGGNTTPTGTSAAESLATPSVDLRRSSAPAGPVSARITPGGTTPAGTSPTGTTPAGTAPTGTAPAGTTPTGTPAPAASFGDTPSRAAASGDPGSAGSRVSGPTSASPIGPVSQPSNPVATLPAARGSATALRRSSATSDRAAVERETPSDAVVARRRPGPVVLRSMTGPGLGAGTAPSAGARTASVWGSTLWLGSRPSLAAPMGSAGTENESGDHSVARGIGGIAAGATGRTITVRRSQFGLGPVIAGIPAVRGVAGSMTRVGSSAAAATGAGLGRPALDQDRKGQVGGRHRSATKSSPDEQVQPAAVSRAPLGGDPQRHQQWPAASARPVRRFATAGPLARAAGPRPDSRTVHWNDAASGSQPALGSHRRSAPGHGGAAGAGHIGPTGALPMPGTVAALLVATRTAGAAPGWSGDGSANGSGQQTTTLRRSVSSAVQAAVNRTTRLPARATALPLTRADESASATGSPSVYSGTSARARTSVASQPNAISRSATAEHGYQEALRPRPSSPGTNAPTGSPTGLSAVSAVSAPEVGTVRRAVATPTGAGSAAEVSTVRSGHPDSPTAARWSMVGPTLLRSIGPLATPVRAGVPIHPAASAGQAAVAMPSASMVRSTLRPSASRIAPASMFGSTARQSAAGIPPASAVGSTLRRSASGTRQTSLAGSPIRRSTSKYSGSLPVTAVGVTGFKSAFGGAGSRNPNAAAGRQHLIGVQARATAPSGTARPVSAPSWFGGAVSAPIQVARVPTGPAPTGLPVRRSELIPQSAGPGTNGSAGGVLSAGRSTQPEGNGSSGTADPRLLNASTAHGTPAGSRTDTSGTARPWFSPSIRRVVAPSERDIEPTTRSLLAQPTVVPPRSAPRGTSVGPGLAGAAATGSTATSAPPFELGGTKGGPPVPATATGRATGETSTGAGTTIRRSLVDQVPASLFDRARTQLSGAPATRRPDATIRRVHEMNPLQSSQSDRSSDEQRPGSIASSLTPREWDQLVDIIVERLEDRVSDELGRRGRRFTPGVM